MTQGGAQEGPRGSGEDPPGLPGPGAALGRLVAEFEFRVLVGLGEYNVALTRVRQTSATAMLIWRSLFRLWGSGTGVAAHSNSLKITQFHSKST